MNQITMYPSKVRLKKNANMDRSKVTVPDKPQTEWDHYAIAFGGYVWLRLAGEGDLTKVYVVEKQVFLATVEGLVGNRFYAEQEAKYAAVGKKTSTKTRDNYWNRFTKMRLKPKEDGGYTAELSDEYFERRISQEILLRAKKDLARMWK